MRRTVLSAALALALAPFIPATANHCAAPIYLFASVRPSPQDDGLPVITSSASCLVAPEEEANSDVIYPGANALQVRWLNTAEPVSGTLAFAGQTYDLEWHPAYISWVGTAVAALDSQWIDVDPLDTLAGNTAVVTICDAEPCDDPGNLSVRTYRTLVP